MTTFLIIACAISGVIWWLMACTAIYHLGRIADAMEARQRIEASIWSATPDGNTSTEASE